MAFRIESTFTKIFLLALLAVIANVGEGQAQYPHPLPVLGYPVVTTSTLAVMGVTYLNNQSDGVYYPPGNITAADVFYGVPFAEPQNGSNRFEKPVPIAAYQTLLDASTPMTLPQCEAQRGTSNATAGYGIYWAGPSEDCLRLIIYRPAGANANSKLPVLVYIYGGSLIGGSSVEYSPAFQVLGGPALGFQNYYVPANGGNVVVQIQYRLGLYGFAADGTSQFSGNLGYWDSLLSLQWINENIAAFGGDPSRVTVMGDSAGAAITSVMSVHPVATHLINATIQSCGTLNNAYAAPSNVSIPSLQFVAQKANCTVPSQLKSCLQGVPFETLQYAQQQLTAYTASFDFPHWGPIFDNDFFPTEDFTTLIAAAPPKPTLFLFTTDEATVITPYFCSIIQDGNFTCPAQGTGPASGNNYTASTLQSLVNHFVMPSPSDPNNSVAVAQTPAMQNAIYNFYANVDNQANVTQSVFYYVQFNRMVSDAIFIIPLLWEARLKAQFGWPVAITHFDYWAQNAYPNLTYAYLAIPHCTHIQYDIIASLFPSFNWYQNGTLTVGVYPNTGYTATDVYLTKIFQQGYQNVIVNQTLPPNWVQPGFSGDYSCSSVNYTANVLTTTKGVETSSMEIGQRLAFWDSLAMQYDFSVMRGFPNTMQQCKPPPPCANRTALVAPSASCNNCIPLLAAINTTRVSWSYPNQVQFNPTYAAITTALNNATATPAQKVNAVMARLSAWQGYVPSNRARMMATMLGSWGRLQAFMDCGTM